jgi:hypothetical protein
MIQELVFDLLCRLWGAVAFVDDNERMILVTHGFQNLKRRTTDDLLVLNTSPNNFSHSVAQVYLLEFSRSIENQLNCKLFL